MRYFLLLTFVLHSGLCFPQDSISSNEISTALIILNKARKAADLDTVTISMSLSNGCYQHAKYLVMNKDNPLVCGMSAHKEYSSLKGYSKEGEIAGQSSVIHYVKPTEAIGGWLQTFYHRIPLLQPNLKEIGIAFYEKDGYVVSLIDCISGAHGENTKDVVYYPSDNQNNVPVSMGNEIPNPMGADGSSGFPITIYFTQEQEVTNVRITLMDKNNKVVFCSVSTPERPATYFTQWNTICAIPRKPLIPSMTYTVTVKCIVNKKPFEKTFSFKTEKTE